MNRYVQLERYKPSLYTPPVDILGKAMVVMQERYDKNLAAAEEIKNQFIPSLPQDRQRANELQNQYSGMVDEVVAKYHGDYAQATNELTKMLYQIKKDFGPGGEAGAIIQNYGMYQNWLKDSQDLVEKGKALGEDLNEAHAYEMNKYSGIGQRDPVSGSFRRFNPETLTEYVDPEKIAQSVADATKPITIKNSRTVFQNGLQTDITDELSGVTADRLHPAIQSALTSNPQYMAYVQQKARRLGASPDDVMDMIADFSQKRASSLSYLSPTHLEQSRVDPRSLIRLRANLQKQNMQEVLGTFYQHEPTIDVLTKEQSTITPDNFRVSDAKTGPYELGSRSFGVNVQGRTLDRALSTGKQDGTPFAKLLEDPLYIERTKVDKPLAEASLQYKIAQLDKDPAKAMQIYNSKYGKNKAWTDKFDKEVVSFYKENEIDNSRFKALSQPIVSPEANKQVVRRIAGQLFDPKRVSVYEVGKAGISHAKDFNLTAEDLISEDGFLPQVSYVKPGPGYIKAGYQIPTKKGTFVFVDQDTGRQSASNELERALRPLFFEGKMQSESPLRVGYRGDKPVYAKVSGHYLPNERGGLTFTLFGEEMEEKNGKLQGTGRAQPVDLEWLYKQYDPEFEGAYGAGASSKESQLFPLFYEMMSNYAREEE